MATFASTASTMCEAFQATLRRSPDAIALRTVGDGTTMTFAHWGERVRAIAAGLSSIGVGRGDTIAVMMTNRPEFYPIDVAAQHLGAAPFSVYNTSAPEQIDYYLNDSAAKVVVAEEQFVAKLLAAKEGTKVEHVVCIDGVPAGTIGLDELTASTEASFDFERAWRAVRSDDLLTLIYTSGTTGDPKGVQVTHGNMIAMVDSAEKLWDSTANDRVISFLPSAHIADRLSSLYHLMVVGNQLTTVADRNDLAAALVDVRPTIFGAVPQVWQKLKSGVEARLSEATGVKAVLAQWALHVGRTASDREFACKGIDPVLRAQRILADRLVLSKLRHAVGLDNPKLAISAAAPISEEVLRFFNGVGIPLSDAWGMSELSGVVTMSPKGKVRPGTVGAPMDGVEVRIAEDGEVLVRGKMVMRGYLNKPEKTAETVDPDGWLHTGDVGELDDRGYLKIVDRKKELIINAGGKNMSPATIESWIKAFSPLIGQAVAIGDNRKYNVALISLDPDAVATFAGRHGLPTDPADLASNTVVLDAVSEAIERANAKLSRVEQIKKFTIVPEYWEPGTEVLTATMKPRRKQIDDRYSETIEEMYARADTSKQ